jgi:hypothetical protein
MADTMGQRQARQQAFTPTPARDPMSPEHRAIESERRARQQAAALDPTLNGRDSDRRLHAND